MTMEMERDGGEEKGKVGEEKKEEKVGEARGREGAGMSFSLYGFCLSGTSVLRYAIYNYLGFTNDSLDIVLNSATPQFYQDNGFVFRWSDHCNHG